MLRDAGYQIDAMSVREMERLILVEQYKPLLTQAGFVPERMSARELRNAIRNQMTDAPTPAPTPAPAPARAVEPPTPAPADVPPTEAAQAAINALIESTSPNVQVFYNGKIVDMGYVTDPPVARLTKKHLEEQFKLAAQRAMDNGATVGYVKMPDGTIFQVNQGSKKAKRLSLDAPAPAASTPTPTPAPARAVEPPTPAPTPAPTPKGKPQQQNAFAETAEDLPIFSGQAPRSGEGATFAPQPVARQDTMFDTRPQMGKREANYAPKRYTIGDDAKAEIDALRSARAELRMEWDQKVRAVYEGVGGLDAYVMKYKRGDDVSLNLEKGEVQSFRDVYGGANVAGRAIENENDVLAILQQYVDFGRQIRQLEGTVAKSKTFSKMSANEIVTAVEDELRAAGFTDADIADLRKADRGSVLDTVEGVRDEINEDFNMRTYEFTVPTPEEMLGFQKGESVYDNLRNWIARLRKVGNNTAPQMAEVAQANIRGLNDLEATLLREMPGLLQGAPNELNGFQKLAVLDEVRQWLPQYDNALAQAQEVGNSMVNWIMLNYSDRRNFDTILQMIGIPYHYFWSRMPSRLAMAALTKPELVNFYYEATRAIGLENEQADVPQRLEGTLPGPGNSRVQVKRTLDYAIPGMSYFQPNPFAGEPLDEGELAQWANTWEKWAPGFGPLGSLMIDLASNGQLDGNYGAVLNDLMPIPPSSIYQMATGNMPQQGAPIMGVPTGFGPNEFDPDRARRAIASIGVEEELGDVLTGYANQVVLNQYNGVPISTDIPPEMLQAAIDLANRGVRRAAEDRLAGRGSAWATGANVQPYPQSEQEMRQAQNAYFAAGYDPTLNPDGSKALQNAVLDETELPTWWTKNDETPGVDAQLSDLYDEQRRLREEKIEAEQAAVNALDLGSASKEEIYNARTEAGAPYQAQIDANDQRIEQLQGQQTPDTMPNNPNQGMSPAEISTRYVTDVLYDAGRLPGRPEWPGDNASSQAKREYYEAQRRYEAAQQAYVVNALAGPVMSTSDQVREMRGPAQYTEEEAVEVWKNWRNRNKTDGEIQRVAALDAITEANRVQWENRKADVYTTFGDDVGTLYEQYLNLPEGDARAQFKAQNPELRAVGLYTWNPEQYAYLAQTYSPEAIMVWARTPAWEDSEEGRARRSAYYDLHPEAFEINAWLYGRPGSAGEQDITDDDTFSYNFGTDYDQAKQLFGDNIWSVVGGYKRGWDKQTKSAYFDANPQLSGFFDWWYAKLPSSSTASRNEFRTSGYGQRYGTYGGGWSGGGWSGSSSSWGGRDDPAYVRPEQFDQRLMPQLGQLRRWEPTRNNTNWINEGRALEYRRRGKWEPPAFGRTRVL